MKKTFTARFNWGEAVVLKTDPTTIRQISGMMLRPLPDKKKVFVTYGLIKGEEETWHNEFEIATYGQQFKVKGFKNG
jgi:ribosomal protein S10